MGYPFSRTNDTFFFFFFFGDRCIFDTFGMHSRCHGRHCYFIAKRILLVENIPLLLKRDSNLIMFKKYFSNYTKVLNHF